MILDKLMVGYSPTGAFAGVILILIQTIYWYISLYRNPTVRNKINKGLRVITLALGVVVNSFIIIAGVLWNGIDLYMFESVISDYCIGLYNVGFVFGFMFCLSLVFAALFLYMEYCRQKVVRNEKRKKFLRDTDTMVR